MSPSNGSTSSSRPRGSWCRHTCGGATSVGGSGSPPTPRPGNTPEESILAVFDWLHEWFGEPDFRGCAFGNSFGELGATSPAVAETARAHKEAFFRYLAELTAAAGKPAPLADHLALLAEGAITTAAITGSPEPAHRAQEAARLLLAAA